MIPNGVLQTALEELAAITRMGLALYGPEGEALAGVDMQGPGGDTLAAFAHSMADSQALGDTHLFKVAEGGDLAYMLAVQGGSQDGYMVGRIAVSQLQQLLKVCKDKLDKSHFYQNLLLDNFLLVDVYNRAKKLGIAPKASRVVFVIEPEKKEMDAMVEELLQGIFAGAADCVTAVEAGRILLVKTLGREAEPAQLAQTIVGMANTELMANVRVAYGGTAEELRDVSRSYKEAKMALEVGRIFYGERSSLSYGDLGIGRLIYQLPVNLCRMFMEELFGPGGRLELDEESRHTVGTFFANNLNVSETARQLFLHRNTLVYRLERIQKQTGLDLRNFEEALLLKIAWMVASYMEYLERQ